MKRAIAWAAAAIGLTIAPSIAAAPSVWGRARDSGVDRQATIIAEAEQLLLKYQRLGSRNVDRDLGPREIAALGEAYLTRAAELLEQSGAASAGDPFTRLRLAELYSSMRRPDKARAVLESILAAGPPPAVQAIAYAELAICYARLGRPADEIRAYTAALDVQPMADRRALLLANRAEAFMVTGDTTAAVEGYRAALAVLSQYGMVHGTGPTTLWGLAVALDRSGDLAGSFEAVKLARTYDERDQHLNGPGWFYVPDYDRHWYAALGHWTAARVTPVGAVRVDAYGRAVAAWKQYLAVAPPDDKWIAIARARLKQCEKESDEVRRRGPREAKPAPAGASVEAVDQLPPFLARTLYGSGSRSQSHWSFPDPEAFLRETRLAVR